MNRSGPFPFTPLGLPADLPHPVERAGTLSLEKKATDVVALDLRGLSTATDHFLLATGNSDIQVRAIAENILEGLKKEGVRPSHVEGMAAGQWVLLDYIDFVVHVFHPAARSYYQLEQLWGDAPRVELEGREE